MNRRTLLTTVVGTTAALALALAVVAAWRLLPQVPEEARNLVGAVCGVAALGAATALFANVGWALGGAEGARWGHGVATVAWITTGAYLLLQRRRDGGTAGTVAGLALIAGAVAKLFLFDLAALDGAVRVIAFLLVGITLLGGQNLAPEVRRDAAHVVVDGRDDRDRLLGHVDAGEDLGRFRDAGQALGEDLGTVERALLLRAELLRARDLERDGLGRDHMHQRTALDTGEDDALQLLLDLLDRLAGELEPRLRVGKLDTDAVPDIAARYGWPVVLVVDVSGAAQSAARPLFGTPRGVTMG